MSLKVASMVQNTVNTGKTAGKGKIPRYLYHFTTVDNFAKIQEDTFCKAQWNDPYMEKNAIFMVDLPNFLKDWGNKKIKREINLQEALYEHLTFHPSGIVVLKVPTSNLEVEKLKVRSQNTFFDAVYKERRLSREECQHLYHGDSATNSSLYKQRKCPIEYIYLDNIPLDKVEPIGKLTLDDLRQADEYKARFWGFDRRGWNMKDVLSILFKDTPEQKAIEKMGTK